MSRQYQTFEPDNIKEVEGGYCVQFRNGSKPLDIIFKKETLEKISRLFSGGISIKNIGEDEFVDSTIAEIEDDLGNSMRIFLPKDKDEWNNENPRGLNFVSGGHYQ